jgi:serine/threonine protein kinase
MGAVYRARDTRLNRDVAVKVLADALRDDPDFEQRFQNEARALSQLARRPTSHRSRSTRRGTSRFRLRPPWPSRIRPSLVHGAVKKKATANTDGR